MARALVQLLALVLGPVFRRAWRYGPVRAVVITAYALIAAGFLAASFFSVFQMGGYGATDDSAYLWSGALVVAIALGVGGLLLGWDRPEAWWRRAAWLSAPTVLLLLWMISQGAFVGVSLALLAIALLVAAAATRVGATLRSAPGGSLE